MKKFLAVIGTLLFMTGLLGVTAFADTSTTYDADTHEASVTSGGVTIYYDTLSEAVAAAEDEDTVTLLKDTSISSGYLTISEDITLDLGGHTLTYPAPAKYYGAIYITDGDVTIQNGTILDKRCYGYTTSGLYTIDMYGDSLTTSDLTIEMYSPNAAAYNYIIFGFCTDDNVPSITLGDGTEILDLGNSHASSGYTTNGCVGVTLYGATDNSGAAALAESTDTTGYSSLTVKDGAEIKTYAFAITGSGAKHGTNISIEGGTITSTGSTGIYHPQYGNLTISGGDITGYTSGIEIRAGNLKMTGGTVTGLGAPTETQANGNGTTSDGAGIAVAQHTTKLPINVSISGGTVSGYTALYESNVQDNDEESIAKVVLCLTGGTFTATGSADEETGSSPSAIYSEDCTAFITGGTYSTDPSDSYLDDCSTATITYAGATYYVISSVENAAAAVVDADSNMTLYTDLSSAVSVAESGETVMLLDDVTKSITISTTLTLDLNGFTLTNTSGSHTITVASGGDLTLTDSTSTGVYEDDDVEGLATGTGVVDNVTTKKAALYVEEGGTATLKGGTLKRSAETGTSTNTYYTILNQGTLYIEDGTTVELLVYTTDSDGNTTTSTAGYSSIIDNGWYSGSPSTSGNTAKLYINGGYINGGRYVKNDSYGEMYITGGTIANGSQCAILNWNALTVSGGTIESSVYCSILNCATSGTTYETGSVTITGGTFTYDNSDGDGQLLATTSTSSDVTISGGSFTTVVDSLYCAEGYVPATEYDETTGLYTVTTGTFVASVSDSSGTVLAKYTDLQDAIDDGDGCTVTLLDDVTIANGYLWIDESITLDLNEQALTFTTTSSYYNSAIYIADGDVSIKNGTITDKRSYGYTLYGIKTIWMYGDSLSTSDVTIQQYSPNSTSGYNYILYIQPYDSDDSDDYDNYPAVTLGSGTEITDLGNSHASYGYSTNGSVGVTILGATGNSDASSLESSSDTSTYTSLTVNSGVTINTYAFAITGNGAYHGTTININGGTITSTGSTAIYHPQYGTLNISGGTITGATTGIEIRAGILNMTGGSVTGEGAPTETQSNGNGTTSDGAGIAVAQHTTGLKIEVNISGGMISGYTALYESNVQGNDEDTIAKVSLNLTGGTFTATGSGSAIYSEDCTGFVYPGTYASTAIDEAYCATGYEPSDVITSTGLYTVIAYTVPEDLTVTYDGQAHSVKVETGNSETEETEDTVTYTVTYTYDGTEYTTAPEFTDAGTYTVTYVVTQTGSDESTGTATASGEYTVTIEQADTVVTISDVTVSYGSEYSQTATLAIAEEDAVEGLSLPDGAEAVITYYTDVNCTTEWTASGEETTPVEAGTYYAKAVYEGSTNFAGSSALAVLTIEEADISFSCTSYSGTYDGAAHGITVTSDTTGAEITYSESADGTYSADALTYTNAGTYTVYYKITADNYNTVTGYSTVVITKADQSLSYAESSVSAHVNDTSVSNALTTTTVEGTVTYASSDETVATVDSDGTVTLTGTDGSATITATAAATDNYNEASASYTITVSAHSYEAAVTDPTCTEDGYTTYTCTVCDDTYTADTTDALGHSYEAVVTDPTCTEGGYTTYTCTVCGDTYTADETDALGHSYEAVVTDPTCTEGGYTTYTCTVCGDTYTADETDALGHSYTSDVTTEATCTEDAYTTYTCSVCGDSYVETNEGSATGHSYGEGVVTTEATCTEDGVMTYTCQNDSSHTYTEAIAATGHSYEAVETAATCTEDAYTTYTCSVCGDSYVVTEEGSATGHDYDCENITWTWAEDYSSATATVTCKNDSSHTKTMKAGITTSSTEATADTDAYTVYTAVVTIDDVSYTDEVKVVSEGTATGSGDTGLEEETDGGSAQKTTVKVTTRLRAKATAKSKHSIKLTWKAETGAASYVICATRCGNTASMPKVKTVSADVTSITIKKLRGEQLKAGTYYKFRVYALDEDGNVINTSYLLHTTTKGGKNTNPKAVRIYKNGSKISSVSIKAGSSVKITTKVTKQEKAKTIKQHAKIRYESTNTSVARVNKNGKITAKKKGTCYVYAYAQNGVWKRIKVTVK